MFKDIVYVSDFFYPESSGGAELVDKTIIEDIKCSSITTRNITKFDNSKKYIISNISLLPENLIAELESHKDFIIVEHDYKICKSRHPWRYNDNLVSASDRVNYNLYKNAKAVFVQTTDHLNIFKLNKVEANFINLGCSIWSHTELDTLTKYATTIKNTHKFAVVKSSNWIKNTEGASRFCDAQDIDYSLISENNWESFIKTLSDFPALVFFPLARESCCRLVIEARCLFMNIITTKNYGAVLEQYIKHSGYNLIEYLKIESAKNLKLIKQYAIS